MNWFIKLNAAARQQFPFSGKDLGKLIRIADDKDAAGKTVLIMAERDCRVRHTVLMYEKCVLTVEAPQMHLRVRPSLSQDRPNKIQDITNPIEDMQNCRSLAAAVGA